MARTIFWSWQSDRPARETRNLIRDALKAAIDRIGADLEDASRPELDHDTRGVPGSPDIVATILAKIDAASVFVADVTPIAVSEGGKQIANPNVLIELGYAKRALGTERVILVWNTAYTNLAPEDLPFDMRHRRAPIEYSLSTEANTPELRQVRTALSKRLEAALRSSLDATPASEPAPPPWHPRDDHEPSIWRNGSAALVVNRGNGDGSVGISMQKRPRAYARLLPTKWKPSPDATAILEGPTTHPIPLGGYGGLNWGPTSGGFLAYRSSGRIEDGGVTPTATRWFRDSGEFWGVAASFFTEHEGSCFFSNVYAVEHWNSWLQHTVHVCALLGGGGPFHVELGLDDIQRTVWIGRGWERNVKIQALKNDVRHDASLIDTGLKAIAGLVEAAFSKVLTAYGISQMSHDQYQVLLSK